MTTNPSLVRIATVMKTCRAQDANQIYGAVNQPVLARVPRITKRLLDIGCGTGALGQKIKEEIDCQVVGITHSDSEATLAGECIDEVLVRDLNNFEPLDMEQFDCIVCSHVLEHLYQPDEVLKRMLRLLSPEGTLIVALPNVLFWRQRLNFLRGNFRYTDGGLMDRTHYRFFDWVTAQELLTKNGYLVIEAHADGTFPLSRYLFRAGQWLDRAALKALPGLFGFQFVFVCRPNAS
jgi:2-polyprenyl-3-methyl-5-hydroxy-6-metoxy-1,4-benzoquinol methylase